MSKQAFIKAMGHVDDHILEQYIAEEDRLSARKPLWKRTWVHLTAAAACLTLIVTGFLLFGQKDSGLSITMDELLEMIPHLEGVGTSFYSTITVSDVDELNLRPVPEQDTISAYKNNRTFIPLDEVAFSQYADAVLTRLADSLGAKVPEYTIENSTNRMSEICEKDGFEFDPYIWSVLRGHCELDDMETTFNQGISCYEFSLNFDIRNEDATPFFWNEKALQVDLRQSDEEILNAMEDLKEKLFSVFDVTFSDVLIRRDRDTIRIYYYNAEDEVNTPMADLPHPRPFSNYIYMVFHHLEDSDDPLLPCSLIYYRKSLIDPDDIYTKFEVPMRTLDEAEELLYKGYVFGGYGCPLCMEEQDPIDFEGYDLVGLEYMYSIDSTVYMNNWMPKNAIPFYVFYKEISSGEGVTKYAYTYVPAIEIEGLDEYFEKKFSHHNS